MSDIIIPPDPQITVDGVTIDLHRSGGGQPMLFLGSLETWIREADYLKRLSERFDLLLPQHPGFGHSELPPEFRTVADLAQFYGALLEELDLRDVVLVGSSFGGWIASEIAVRSTHRLSHLVLIDAFGIKVGGRNDRDIQDIYALSQAEVAALFYHDPERNRRDLTRYDDRTLTGIARSREALARFGWCPYMHNPSLKRWLRHVRIPTLVLWGEQDGVCGTAYGRAYAGHFPQSTFVTIPQAGHYPHLEQPERVVAEVAGFVARTGAARAPRAA